MSLRDSLWQLLLWGALPAWLLAGAADWLCHRRSDIAGTSGARESALHLLLYLEIALPLSAALWLELSMPMCLILAAAVAAHMLTSWWDTSVAQPRRFISPLEQQVHSWLEMLPLFALVIAVMLQMGADARPRWELRARGDSMDPGLRLGILLALAAGALPIVEEWWRGLRASRQRLGG